MSTEDTKLIQMKLGPSTLNRLKRIKSITNARTRTDANVIAICVSEWLLHTLNEGSKVYVEYENGEKEKIKFLGLGL